MKDVDENVSQKSGMGIRCLPDINFHNFWWEGIDEADWSNMVNAAADEALQEAGFPCE
tara:strand:+ start:403 stop:576 length:174 start_codon:yes stop_codon:yes gene_type:complete